LMTFNFVYICSFLFMLFTFNILCNINNNNNNSQYSGVSKNFDYGAMAKVSDGYTIGSVVQCIREVITCKRMLQLRVKPLTHIELINALRYEDKLLMIIDIDCHFFIVFYLSYNLPKSNRVCVLFLSVVQKSLFIVRRKKLLYHG
jgi:hypothetical protein